LPGQVTSIIKPGASLAEAARPLAGTKRSEGKFPYQWLYEGPNAKFAFPNGIIPLPAIVPPATQVLATQVMSFQVPEGYRFTLSGILMATNSALYFPGQGLLNFSLVAVYSTGPRNVEYLSNLDFPVGEFTSLAGSMKTVTQRLRQRLEFAPLDVLQIQVSNNPGNTPGGGIPTPNATDVVLGILEGFTYPNSENA
jgi:hypothetical protein